MGFNTGLGLRDYVWDRKGHDEMLVFDDLGMTPGWLTTKFKKKVKTESTLDLHSSVGHNFNVMLMMLWGWGPKSFGNHTTRLWDTSSRHKMLIGANVNLTITGDKNIRSSQKGTDRLGNINIHKKNVWKSYEQLWRYERVAFFPSYVLSLAGQKNQQEINNKEENKARQ